MLVSLPPPYGSSWRHAARTRCTVSASAHKSVKELIDAASKPGQPGVTPQLFDKVVDDVTGTLNLDVWPRYKEAVLKGEDIPLRMGYVGVKMRSQADIDQSKRVRDALVPSVAKINEKIKFEMKTKMRNEK